MKKLKIAVTGGIGSGKSEVCKYITSRGFEVISADNIAKNILSTDKSIQQKIMDKFGRDSFTNGTPNVKFLADKVFSKQENVKKMNSIVHPAAIEEINRRMNDILKKHNIVFCESALIFEANMENMFDYVVSVAADDDTRIKRVVEREKTSEEEIRLRMENQISDAERKQLSDFIIYNDSTLDGLKNKVDFFLNLFNTIAMSDNVEN